LSSALARLDCIYVTASARDARFTRICVASIRYFYPDVCIKLLPGSPLEEGLTEELARHWNVRLSDVAIGNWGWGFVKLEPLFGTPGERFLVVDSDTVFIGPVVGTWSASSADFLVDDEQQSESDTHRLYYDWRKVRTVDSRAREPQFVFNTGQWFGTAGILTRADFSALMDWSGMPPKIRYPELFMPGDQGVLNYIINQKVTTKGITVDRRKIMWWPGRGMNNLTAEEIIGRTAPPLIIHWAGMKRSRLGDMAGADVLRCFEVLYYSRLPHGSVQRLLASVRYPTAVWWHDLRHRIRHRIGSKQTRSLS
jgi:hypothetical protein